jgi:hypothetical protein
VEIGGDFPAFAGDFPRFSGDFALRRKSHENLSR